MNKMTFLLSASLSLYGFSSFATVINVQDEKSIEQAMNRALSKSIGQASTEAFEGLSKDTLIFESGDSKGEIEVEINGITLGRRPGKTKFKNITLRTTPYTVDKLVVIKTSKIEDLMIIEPFEEKLLRFRTTRSIKISDANFVDCKGCPEIWSGYSLKTVMTSKDSGDSLVSHQTYPSEPREIGSGMASGKRRNQEMDTQDSALMANWMSAFNKRAEKSMVLEYKDLDQESLELLKAAKVVRVKVKFPWLTTTVDSEMVTRINLSQSFKSTSVKIEFAIKENGIK